MDQVPFVGRHAELRDLRERISQGAAGDGRIVLIEGDPGIGKSMLLDALLRSLSSTPSLEGFIAASGQCHVGTGPQTAYQPFAELLACLDRGVGQDGRLVAGLKSILKETAPDWLALVPVVGPALGATAKTASLGIDFIRTGEVSRERSDALADQYLAALRELARGSRLVVLMIEDAQWIDHASVDLLLRMQHAMDGMSVVVLMTYRPGEAEGDGPMQRLRFELATRGRLEIVTLEGLDRADISAYLERRFGSTLTPDFPAYLAYLCDGQPLFLSQYLHLLEQERIIHRTEGGYELDGSVVRHSGGWEVVGRLEDMPASSNIDELLDRRIRGLLREEQEMLQIGSVQGLAFDSVVLAELTEMGELSVLARLRQVAEGHHIIALATGEDWQRDRSAVYAFEHMLMRQAFYRRLSERERVLHHQQTARILERSLTEYERPPRNLLVEIAFHNKSGRQHEAAATRYLAAARDTYADGAAVEAGYLVADAIACLASVPATTGERDRLVAEAVLLRLQCSIYGFASASDISHLLQIATEGEAAAARADEGALRAEIVSLTGHLHVRAGRVPLGISELRRGVELARATGDPLAEFFALTQLGHQVAKESLSESMTVRYQALDVFHDHVSPDSLPPGQRDGILRVQATLQVSLGLGEFDRGNFETAVQWLERGIAASRELRLIDELPAAHNYLAQVYASMGRFEEAVELLENAIRLHEQRGGDREDAWVGYNLGLLAKVRLEMGRFGSAADTIAEAVDISEATKHLDLLPLVWNYQAEILMHPANPGADLDRAERVLRNNLAVCAAAGLTRSAVQAHSLLGQLLLRRNSFGLAFDASSMAVTELSRLGSLPAVRTEEILFHHSLVLEKLGRNGEANTYLERAWQAAEQKLASMTAPENRSRFVQRVPLTRSILEAYTANHPDMVASSGVSGAD